VPGRVREAAEPVVVEVAVLAVSVQLSASAAMPSSSSSGIAEIASTSALASLLRR